jgi:hypothetical protein
LWDDFCQYIVNGKITYNGIEIAIFHTAWGDGHYKSSDTFVYFPVDSGTIAAIPYNADFLRQDIPSHEHYLYATDSNGIECEYKNGTIRFGNLEIYTNQSDEQFFRED